MPSKTPDQVTVRALKIAKERFDWNQVQFAEAIQADKQHITNWLSRGMPARAHAKVATALRITVEELLTGRPPENTADVEAARRVAEQPITAYGVTVKSREAMLFAADWEQLRAPLKAQIQAMVQTLVAEQVREERRTRGKPGPDRDTDRPNA